MSVSGKSVAVSGVGVSECRGVEVSSVGVSPKGMLSGVRDGVRVSAGEAGTQEERRRKERRKRKEEGFRGCMGWSLA